MNRPILIFLLALAAVSGVRAEPDKLTAYRARFESYLGDLVYDSPALRASWGNAYQKSLDVLADQLQQAGQLEALLEVRREINRFSHNRTIPEQALSPTCEELRETQEAFARKPVEAALKNSNSIIKLLDKYDATLSELESTLTVEGKISDALKVRAERMRIKELGALKTAKFNVAMYAYENQRLVPAGAEQAGIPAEDKVIQTGDLMATRTEDGVTVSASQPPKAAPGLIYKRVPLSRTPNASMRRPLSVSMQMASDEQARVDADRITKTATSHPQIMIMATPAAGTLQNVVVIIRGYERDTSGVGRSALRARPAHTIRFPALTKTPVYLDLPPIETRTERTRRGDPLSGSEFEGVVISVVDEDGDLIYQAASSRRLSQAAFRNPVRQAPDGNAADFQGIK